MMIALHIGTKARQFTCCLIVAVTAIVLTPRADAAADKGSSKTLTFFNREIATFRSQSANMTPDERLRDAGHHLIEAGDKLNDPGVKVTGINVGEEKGKRFKAGDIYLFTLLESDLDLLAGETLDETSKRAVEHLRLAMEARQAQGEPRAILEGVGVVTVATLLLLVSWFLIRRAGHWLIAKIEKWIKRITQLNIPRSDLRPHLILLLKKLVRVAQTLAILVLINIWLSTSLHQFPVTAPWGNALGSKLGELAAQLTAGFLTALPGLGIVVLIIIIARWLARLSDQLIKGLSAAESATSLMSTDTARATRRIVTAIIWLFAIVMSYPYLPGSGSVAFQGISVVLGLMISLGSSGMINQIMSGFVMLYSGSVRTGEYVKVGQLEGTVTEMGMLATKIMTPRREFISVPNAVLVSNPTHNFSRLADEHGAVCTTSVTIGYDTPWRQVHAMLKIAAERTPGARNDPEPRILQTGLLDHYAEYTLVFYIKQPSARPSVLSRLHSEIQDIFNEHGVQIMSPHFREQPEEDIIVPKSHWFDKPATPPTGEEQDKLKGA